MIIKFQRWFWVKKVDAFNAEKIIPSSDGFHALMNGDKKLSADVYIVTARSATEVCRAKLIVQ